MALHPYRDNELNYFKFLSLVLNEFPRALRHAFKTMWDNTFGHRRDFHLWDDSADVRNLFLSTEGGATKVPTNQSFKEWDCTALFHATIFAKSFAIHHRTLHELYVQPLAVPEGSFHVSLVSRVGNNAEIFALAIDQLRRLKHSLFHSTSAEMDRATFDLYIQYTKDAFTALAVSTARIDAIGNLTQSDFPTSRVRDLEERMRRENQSYTKWVEGISVTIQEIRTLVTFITMSTFVIILILIIVTVFMESQLANKEDVAFLKDLKINYWKKTEKDQNVVDSNTYTCIKEDQSLLLDKYQLLHYRSALESHLRALTVTRKLYGEDHARTADSYHQLGITQRDLRDLPSAIDSHQRALNITRKLFGEEHPRTADNYHQLAITQRDFGDYHSALDLHQRDLHATRKLYGEDNGRTAYSYHQLGITQRELHDLPSALDSHQRALHITRKLFGEEHPRTVENYHQLGITQREDTRAGTVRH